MATAVVNAILSVVLLVPAVRTGPATAWVTLVAVLVGSLVLEAIFRRRRR